MAVEGEVSDDGRCAIVLSFYAAVGLHFKFSFPVYRHPADESPPLSPFSPTVALIREHVQKVSALGSEFSEN